MRGGGKARIRRIAINDRLCIHKARLQRQKDEVRAQLRADRKERELEVVRRIEELAEIEAGKLTKEKRNTCLYVCSFLVLLLLFNLLSWHYFLTRQIEGKPGDV